MTDWQIGDIVLCVSGKEVSNHDGGLDSYGNRVLAIGGIYTVEEVVYAQGMTGLVLEGYRPKLPIRGYLSSCFSKIHPLTEEEHLQAIRELADDELIANPEGRTTGGPHGLDTKNHNRPCGPIKD